MNGVLIVAVTLCALFGSRQLPPLSFSAEAPRDKNLNALNEAQTLTCYVGTSTGGSLVGGLGTGLTQQSNCSACMKSSTGVSAAGVSVSETTSSCVPVGQTCTPGSVGVGSLAGQTTFCCSTNLCNTSSGRQYLNVLLGVFGLLTAVVTVVKMS